MKKAHELLKKHKALLICDEIQAGLGRTGSLLCSDQDNVRPDMVCLGKALSGGFYPVSAVLADNFIMDHIKPGQHGSTYGGNPLGAQTAITALDVLIEEGMIENSAKQGEKLINNLKKIIKGDQLKEIRGRGLFIGVEFHNEEYAYALSRKMLELGLIAKPTQKTTIRFSPPLVITDGQLDEATSIIEKAWNSIK